MGRDSDSLVAGNVEEAGEAGFELRKLAAADLDQVLAIEIESFPKPWSRTSFERELALPQSRTLVACGQDRIVGYVCRWRIEDEIQILNVAVAPTVRRRGVARLLLLAVLAEAAQAGLSVTLEVARDNDPAIALYEHLGFVRTGERKDFYGRGRPGIMMACDPRSKAVAGR